MLSAYRVLDLSDERGALCGRILADLGADVIAVEPRAGDPLRARGPFLAGRPGPDRSLPWLAAAAGKRSIALDLAQDGADRETLRALVASADVLIESAAPGRMASWGLSAESLEAGLPAGHPGLIHCAITPFGQTGPHADYSAHDLVVVAMGGNACMTGDPAGPPIVCSLPTGYFHAGAEAALAVTMALCSRSQLGHGQRIDVSMQECQLSTLITGVGQYALTGRLPQRGGYRTGRTREIWRCKDGFVSYGLRGGPARAGSLAATVEYMAECGMAPAHLREMDWSHYSPLTLEEDELERLESAFAGFFATKTMRELYEQALARRILLAPCNDAREILDQVQLRARGFFQSVEYPALGASVEHPARFARSSRDQIRLRRPAPALDADGPALRAEIAAGGRTAREVPRHAAAPEAGHVGARGIFEGLRILELGSGAAGPVATRYFAEQGATVIRIESARRPDFLRTLHLTRDNRDTPDILERAPMFVLLNPNKQSLAIDMKSSEGVDLVKRLVAWSDVVAENFAPGVMQKWGLDYEHLRRIKPEIIMLSGCLFGQTGPQRSYPGFGGQGAAIAGFNHMTGLPDAEALGPFATITDSLAPRFTATALAAAILELRRSGQGQHIDLSQIEAGVYCLAEMIVRASASGEVMKRLGNRSESAAPHGLYRCRDEERCERNPTGERWIAIAISSEAQWAGLRETMGRPDWAEDERFSSAASRLRHVEALDAALADWLRERDARLLVPQLQARGVDAGCVQSFADLLDDPQLAGRDHFVELDHEPLGRLLFERSGFRFSHTPGGLRSAGPRLGEHTREILTDVLGLGEDEVARLAREEITV